ncbi:MAG TPA: hypothetical protein VMR98_00575, partial [Candidatus Polarisedimenticolaceae bacterium]|nr:hypothetical protein [Candidatus Polarisedimenticolaceae bacterium]
CVAAPAAAATSEPTTRDVAGLGMSEKTKAYEYAGYGVVAKVHALRYRFANNRWMVDTVTRVYLGDGNVVWVCLSRLSFAPPKNGLVSFTDRNMNGAAQPGQPCLLTGFAANLRAIFGIAEAETTPASV